MGLRKILTVDESALHKTCRPVESFDKKLHALLKDMTDTLVDSGGVGLAAPQVGILRRIAVVEVNEGEVIELINPEIIAREGEQQETEGCLSIPGRFGITKRPKRVTVRATNRKGEVYEITGEDLLARALCHEIDHLDGHLFTERTVRMLDEEN